MFFTQEDYRKIEKWLTANSRKDTDFVGAATPLKGNETVVLVQDGKNVKTSVKDIVDQFFLLGVSDFLNITDKYGESYISLTQAIQLIPFRSRKEGQVITFIDESGNWAIYQFQGKALNQWNNTTLWNNPFDWEKFIFDSILPDEEDLTKSAPDANGNAYLSLKDREYNPESFSGLGRVILRKNIVEIDDPIYGKVTKNILFQDMIAQANTIYEIRYDYNLNGNTVTIPEGCILDMRGGSVANGTINCVDTIIISTDASKLDITLTGTYRFDSEKLVTLNTEDINISQSVDRKSHTISAMLADRDTTNGMGYVILRKGQSFASQLTQQNTIYVIRYDFTLTGNVTVPANCILEFDGGSVRGEHTITGTNTGINAGLVKIFNTDVTLAGTWSLEAAYPEWFGAKGDGVTDDTIAIKTLIHNIENFLPLKVYEKGSVPTKDWSQIVINFSKIYAVTNTIKFYHCNNLIIKNLRIKAISNSDTSFSLLKFGITRNVIIDNCFIDCNFYCATAIDLTDYTIGSCLTNTNIHGFLNYGFLAQNHGYEWKLNNVKIEQKLWEENGIIQTEHGIGIYLSDGQGDYKFVNVIVSYCSEYGVVVNSTANFFSQLHVYGCGIKNNNVVNHFDNCYISDKFETKGYVTITNSYIITETSPIITSIEPSETEWRNGYSIITNNIIRSSKSNAVLYNTELSKSNYPYTVGNSFQNVGIITNKGLDAVFGNPFKPSVEKTYSTSTVSSINLGNAVMFYGNSSETSTINFPYLLPEIYISNVCANEPNVVCSISSVWEGGATITTTGPCSWFVLGKI